MPRKGVSRETLLDGAQMELSAFLAGTIGFLKERNIPIKEWVTYIGEMFEGSLDELEGRDLIA
jgi:hypothetical protein